MGKDGISFQPKMSTNQQIKVRTQVLCKDLRYPALSANLINKLELFSLVSQSAMHLKRDIWSRTLVTKNFGAT